MVGNIKRHFGKIVQRELTGVGMWNCVLVCTYLGCVLDQLSKRAVILCVMHDLIVCALYIELKSGDWSFILLKNIMIKQCKLQYSIEIVYVFKILVQYCDSKKRSAFDEVSE